MAKVYINGNIAPIAKPLEVDFDPVRGLIVQQEYYSAGDNLTGLANYCIANRIAFKLKRSPIQSSMSITYSGGQQGLPDVPQVNWELLGNEIQKSVLESGIALAGMELYPSLIADVKLGMAAVEAGDSAAEGDIYDSLPEGEQSYYSALLGFLMRSQTHFPQGQYVLRRTYSVSNWYSGELPGEQNVEKLIGMAAMLTYGMPLVMQNKLASIPIPAGHTGYAWSWRQLPSRMVTSGQNRVEVSTEWWFEEWSTQLYPLA